MRYLKRIFVLFNFFLISVSLVGQESGCGFILEMTLDKVVEDARNQSLSSVIAKHKFLVSYWEFRTYKAQFLPSLSFKANLGEYNRSISALRDPNTGEFHYVVDNYLHNSASLVLSQNIPFTGGTLSLISSLSRLDQYTPNRNIVYNSQPIYLSYSQPLFTYNKLKWEKQIEPVKYEMAKRAYVEAIEDAVVSSVALFFQLLLANENLELAIRREENDRQLLQIAEERYKLGTLSRDELLQISHQLLNDDLSIRDCRMNVEMLMVRLKNFLGYNDNVIIVPKVPEFEGALVIDKEEFISRAEQSSSHLLQKKIERLEAEAAVAQAKSQRGISVSLYAQFGMTQVGADITSAYRKPIDQEVVGLSITMPILDWGLGKGKVQVAKSQLDVINMTLEQQTQEWYQNLLMKVSRFNLMGHQCLTSKEADKIGKERYQTARNRFTNGTISITELNTAQDNMDNSSLQYLEKIGDFWVVYYEICRLSLYDYINKSDLIKDYDSILNNIGN